MVATRNDKTAGRHANAYRRATPYRTLALCATFGVVCFYLGVLLGSVTFASHSSCSSAEELNTRVEERVNEISSAWKYKHKLEQEDTAARIPANLHDIVQGMTRVDRNEFAALFPMGVPLDPSSPQNDQVVILHNSPRSLPTDPFAAAEASSQTTIPLLSAADATENCDNLHVVLTDHNLKRRQCVALMGQYEAFHLQKFMRLPQSGKLDPHLPLRLVNRGAHQSGRKSTKTPTMEQTMQAWSTLTPYLQNITQTLDKLRPIAASVAVDNTIVVMVCNHGQSELLLNFACAARARGLDTALEAVLVFATDEETRDLAIGLGLSVFYDPVVFGEMPKEAARAYADVKFRAMMMAKVYCVQLVSMLGYDLLFQDVDIVWLRNPLEYFHNDTSSANDEVSPDYYDVYFQDDGNHAIYYAPYSANTGFYFVRHNDKTRYFFNSLLLAGDLILTTKSHQIPLVALLQEHASMYGLKVKIFSRLENDFPGGHAYHRRKDFMKDYFAGHVNPYLFHMSWTKSKINKGKFFEQMGEWYLRDTCAQKTAQHILDLPDGTSVNQQSLVEPCCMATSVVKCHFRDKASKIPCNDSPAIDKNGRSFW